MQFGHEAATTTPLPVTDASVDAANAMVGMTKLSIKRTEANSTAQVVLVTCSSIRVARTEWPSVAGYTSPSSLRTVGAEIPMARMHRGKGNPACCAVTPYSGKLELLP